ncbi:MAG: M1 family aminopeptidase, partial [Candidatus Sulfotelmatobacter sp.]
MTKVLGASRISLVFTLCFLLAPLLRVAYAAENARSKPAEALYLQLGSVGLDTARVYQVRDASLDRASIHITLEDGTIAFTQDVMGRITGAFFEGEGEILLVPPNEVERKSMSLFTGMAILEERFATAYFRFNDDLMAELKPDLRAAGPQREFLERAGPAAKNLANIDAMRLLTTFSHMLPSADGRSSSSDDASQRDHSDRFLHARLQGTKLGVFDVYFDSTAAEQVLVGQSKAAESGETYYDVWTSFSLTQTARLPAHTTSPESPGENVPGHRIAVRSYKIRTVVVPPKQIQATASLRFEVSTGGARTLLFELSRFLRIESVTLDGQPVEYIHNPALEGTHLARQGNDVVAVILPRTARTGETFELEFKYGGEVLAEAGGGLLYVGARGTWYPNRGLEMANFDLEFRYPTDWTLVATGKPTPIVSGEIPQESGTEQRSHWISDRPIPLAGFNLGKYREVTTRAGDVTVETYATVGVEKDFPSASIQVIEPPRIDAIPRTPQVIPPSPPSPTRQELVVGEAAARAIEYFSHRFGPFPYSQLALTQMPGRESQGWPGLVFLSSYAFLDEQQREQLHFEPYRILLQQSVPAHETAHQWWGDLVTWRGYRDQWFSEGLANYCALMMLQEKDPAGFRQIMEAYRRDLVEKNKDGMTPMDAGPVTLGTRLLSSRFPGGYEAISYGRGTWLFYMLRTMLNDAEHLQSKKASGNPVPVEEPFVRALRNIREQYQGKSITTTELLQ